MKKVSKSLAIRVGVGLRARTKFGIVPIWKFLLALCVRVCEDGGIMKRNIFDIMYKLAVVSLLAFISVKVHFIEYKVHRMPSEFELEQMIDSLKKKVDDIDSRLMFR